MTRFLRSSQCFLLFVCLLITTLTGSAQEPWTLQAVPDSWRSVPKDELAPVNGYSWYRALVRVPEEWQGNDLRMFVEALDDARSTWINGRQIGVAGTFPPQFRSGLGERGRYAIDPENIRFGDFNVVAIRVYQSDPRPNFSVAPPVLVNESRQQAIRLEGGWMYRPGDDTAWSMTTPEAFGIDPALELSDSEAAAKGIFQRVDTVDDLEKYVARRNGDTDPLLPAEAVKHFKTPDDLSVQLVLGDPDIAQPLFIMWDERERLWVMEYRQYPDPAGLKMLSRDTFLRSVYDKVPAPPPHHERGLDRISIHEDADGDGTYENHRIFVDGLSIASSFAVADGGVYVTNPPYLLFYPDKNRDDIPDGNPEVLLEGFGIEDSHSVINSLRMGPDGWLYGAQGSTVTAAVRKPGSKTAPVRSVGQNIWRYHRASETFEVFAEGGGNSFSCEIDSRGRVFSGHNGGDTRGFHYVQGGYYRKGFGKHGPLSNPYAFGFFEHIRHHSAARFSHNFIIYEEQLLPSRFHGKLFGIEPLQGQVVLSDVRPFSSSFETTDLERVLRTDDPWFRPVDIKSGPDGSVYVADLYEQRIDHSSHYAGRIDRTNGRIYRLKPSGENLPRRRSVRDLSELTTGELIKGLSSPDRWLRQTILRILGDRRDTSVQHTLLQQLSAAPPGQLPLDLLWALYLCGGLNDTSAVTLLQHQDPFVRAWTVRLVCDFPLSSLGSPFVAELIDLATNENDIEVRKQLACSARRLPPEAALPVLRNLLRHSEDLPDIHQPLLLWWGIESKVAGFPVDDLIHLLLPDPESWYLPLVADHVLQRLMRRYSSSGTRSDLLSAAALLKAAPSGKSVELLLAGFEEAYHGRSMADIPDELADVIAATGGGSLPLRLRQGQSEAVTAALGIILDPAADPPLRRQLVDILGQTRLAAALPPLLQIVASESEPLLLSAAISALQVFEDPAIADSVLLRLPQLNTETLLTAESLLSSRTIWSKKLLSAVDSGRLSSALISETALKKMLMHGDQEVNDLIQKHWGTVAGASTSSMLAEIARVSDVLKAGTGNPRLGKQLYMKNCGRCHLLFDEGGRIGPDLTPFLRENTERLLVNVINPSQEIREGFENHLILTSDGRILNGFLADKDASVVVLRGIDGQNMIVQTDDIEEMRIIPQSVMPEGALKDLNEQQLRDLFAYIRSSQPVNY